MNQSDEYALIAIDMLEFSRRTALIAESVEAKMPDSEIRRRIVAELGIVQRNYLSVANAALHAAQTLMDGEKPDRPNPFGANDGPRLDRHAGFDLLAATMSPNYGHVIYAFGESIEFRFQGNEKWRLGAFQCSSADGSGYLLVRDNMIGTDYRVSPENCRRAKRAEAVAAE